MFINDKNKFAFLKKIGFTEILLLFFFLTIIVFVFLYFRRSQKWITVEMKVTSDSSISSEQRTIPYWLSNPVKKGDREYSALGQPQAEVIDVLSYETSGSYKETYLTVKLNVLYNKNQHKYTFSSKDLIIGGPLIIRPNGVYLEGIITSMEGVSRETKKARKKVLTQIEGGVSYITSGIKPWFADAIKKGDEMKDSKGQLLAKILEKKVEPARRTTTDDRGIPHLTRDPYLVDVYLTIELETTLDQGAYYFKKNTKVKIGQLIDFSSDKYSFRSTIIDILE